MPLSGEAAKTSGTFVETAVKCEQEPRPPVDRPVPFRRARARGRWRFGLLMQAVACHPRRQSTSTTDELGARTSHLLVARLFHEPTSQL